MGEAVLVTDDEPGIRESLAEILEDAGYAVSTAEDGEQAIALLQDQTFAVVITDLRMPGADGLQVLERVRELAPQTLVLVMTAHATVDTAIRALRAGASDYLLKPVVFDDVLAKIERLLEHRRLLWETQMLRRQLERRFSVDRMIGESQGMKDVGRLIQKVGPTRATVLISGESGTGKEVVARALHHHSEARDRIFLPINCAAIPESLLESQLFGHVKGAFTGAVGAQEGLFARARGGTIFLDEIGDMPLPLQSKLLRVIEEKEILPVGSTTPIRVDVRIVAASHRDLEAMAESGDFREDLYYRLNVVNIHLPPLRERREDIPELVEFLMERHSQAMNRTFQGIDNAALKLLMTHPWKGNVRELDNVIEHAMILADGDWIVPGDLPRSIGGSAGSEDPSGSDDLREALRMYERIHIRTVLVRSGHDKKKAAHTLGLSLSSLYRKIDELGLGEQE